MDKWLNEQIREMRKELQETRESTIRQEQELKEYLPRLRAIERTVMGHAAYVQGQKKWAARAGKLFLAVAGVLVAKLLLR